MAPLHQSFVKRTDPGTSFSIIFSIIAASVVFACAIWGFVIPKWRQRCLADRSRTHWANEATLKTRKRQRLRNAFSNCTGIKPLLSKPSAVKVLPTYDPRNESPFPSSPTTGQSKLFEDLTSRTYSATTRPITMSSNGLFTPIKETLTTEDHAKNKYHTVPRAIEAKNFAGKSTDFGDAKEFILAVPEPLTLKPREAGRPPAVVRHLEKYGTPHSVSPARSDKLLHPNKLFQAIQRADVRSSLCSSTSMRLDHRDSDADADAEAVVAAREVNDALDKAIEEGTNEQQRHYSSDDSSKASSFVDQRNPAQGFKNDLTALHRLRSYRSLTGYQPPRPARAGTITRPKTPVDELRRLYNQAQQSRDISMAALPKILTSSTALTVDEQSEIDSISTPETSPTLPSGGNERLPLRVTCTISPDTSDKEMASSRTLAKSDPQMDSWLNPITSLDFNNKSSQGFFHPGRRSKPVPQMIRTSSYAFRSDHRHRRSLSEVGKDAESVFLSRPLRSRARASSLYSRDTHGHSLAPTPTTSEHHSPMIDIFADHDVVGLSFKKRESVKTRINEWTQRIEDNATPPLPLFRQALPSPQIAKAASLPAMNLVEGAKRQLSPNQSNDSHSNHDLQEDVLVADKESAPGGALWI